MATKAQKAAAKKKRADAKRRKAAAQRVLDDPNASAARKAAARQRRAMWGSAMQIQAGIMGQATQAAVTQADIGDTSSAAYTGAQSIYSDLSGQRETALADMQDQSKTPAERAAARQLALNLAGQMNAQGNIMRQITRRQMGEGTRYIGPTGGALAYDDPRAVAARQLRGLDDPTDW